MKRRLLIISIIVILLSVVQVWAFLARPKVAVNSSVLSDEDKTEIASVAALPRNDKEIAARNDVNIYYAENEEEQELKLELLGTAIGNTKDPIAFIKDLETGKQGIYKLGHKIKEAEIIRIAKGAVELDVNGRKEILKLRTGSEYANVNSPVVISVDGDNILMSKNALLNETGNILETVKKVKIKPYSESQQVIGMRIEGVSQDSLIAQAGIRDKDIVTAVNNQKITSYQKALQVFSKVRNHPEIKVSLLRNGEIKNLNYRFDN